MCHYYYWVNPFNVLQYFELKETTIVHRIIIFNSRMSYGVTEFEFLQGEFHLPGFSGA